MCFLYISSVPDNIKRLMLKFTHMIWNFQKDQCSNVRVSGDGKNIWQLIHLCLGAHAVITQVELELGHDCVWSSFNPIIITQNPRPGSNTLIWVKTLQILWGFTTYRCWVVSTNATNHRKYLKRHCQLRRTLWDGYLECNILIYKKGDVPTCKDDNYSKYWIVYSLDGWMVSFRGILRHFLTNRDNYHLSRSIGAELPVISCSLSVPILLSPAIARC